MCCCERRLYCQRSSMVMQCVLFKSDIYLKQVSHLYKSNEKKTGLLPGEGLKTNLTVSNAMICFGKCSAVMWSTCDLWKIDLSQDRHFDLSHCSRKSTGVTNFVNDGSVSLSVPVSHLSFNISFICLSERKKRSVFLGVYAPYSKTNRLSLLQLLLET